MLTAFRFSALQRAEIPQALDYWGADRGIACFSALQRAEIPQAICCSCAMSGWGAVSVLFSEPKFLKRRPVALRTRRARRFSALQRAEIPQVNLSTLISGALVEFQCSSASRNSSRIGSSAILAVCPCFSALQRAEIPQAITSAAAAISSTVSVLFSEPKFLKPAPVRALHSARRVSVLFSEPKFLKVRRGLPHPLRPRFQCSSASRNSSRLNESGVQWAILEFQCSSASRNSSSHSERPALSGAYIVSVLFSEPKIPQSNYVSGRYYYQRAFQCSSASRKFLNLTGQPVLTLNEVSVLFSEPKIPQWISANRAVGIDHMFQCSSASRKFLNSVTSTNLLHRRRGFSALQRAENSSIRSSGGGGAEIPRVSVLFSEPKIPQCYTPPTSRATRARFQCSSASRKFLNRVPARYGVRV